MQVPDKISPLTSGRPWVLPLPDNHRLHECNQWNIFGMSQCPNGHMCFCWKQVLCCCAKNQRRLNIMLWKRTEKTYTVGIAGNWPWTVSQNAAIKQRIMEYLAALIIAFLQLSATKNKIVIVVSQSCRNFRTVFFIGRWKWWDGIFRQQQQSGRRYLIDGRLFPLRTISGTSAAQVLVRSNTVSRCLR